MRSEPDARFSGSRPGNPQGHVAADAHPARAGPIAGPGKRETAEDRDRRRYARRRSRISCTAPGWVIRCIRCWCRCRSARSCRPRCWTWCPVAAERHHADRASARSSAVPAAAAGLADWSEMTKDRRRVGLVHAAANAVALGLYVGSLAARLLRPPGPWQGAGLRRPVARRRRRLPGRPPRVRAGRRGEPGVPEIAPATRGVDRGGLARLAARGQAGRAHGRRRADPALPAGRPSDRDAGAVLARDRAARRRAMSWAPARRLRGLPLAREHVPAGRRRRGARPGRRTTSRCCAPASPPAWSRSRSLRVSLR